ncbi:MAG: zinc ribbon domain-containing protein [Austwickia sp.]|nr:zinc ribbon domain-containing protein [Austwickia sp.]MBK8436881.1 zinc ribbon domain-containing protein [Austwickia sp.]MBK9100509.1 zinc ribbon domain-containing protein [Austwickia sp.]
MPTYEYRCRECGHQFTVRRPMASSDAAAPCPQGHPDTVRLLTTLGLAGAGRATAVGGPPAGAPGGGCCGGGCGCG